MASRDFLSSNLFELSYAVNVWLIAYKDTVHRKNPDYALRAIKQSGFAKDAIEIIKNIPSITDSILGDASIDNLTEDSFSLNFLNTNCTHHVNYHDDKMCTVEFVAKFSTTIKEILLLEDDIIERLHLEIVTPVGNLQA